MSRFLINQCVLFDEETYTLQRWPIEQDEPRRLGVFASRCLMQLLLARDSVVGKRELMEGAWGQFGLEVTDNSLAQSIRQLRVALEELFPGQECIITVPRIGYRLSNKLLWQACEPEIGPPSPGTAQPASAPVCEPAGTGQARRWLGRRSSSLWGVLILGLGLLAYGAGSLLPSSELAPARLSFASPLRHEGVLIHLPTGSAPPMPDQLQQWAEQARHAALLAQLPGTPLYLYLFEPQKTQGFVCNAPLLDDLGKCLGLLSHETTN